MVGDAHERSTIDSPCHLTVLGFPVFRRRRSILAALLLVSVLGEPQAVILALKSPSTKNGSLWIDVR